MLKWFLTKMLTSLLIKIGFKSAYATALTPIILRTIADAKTALDQAKEDGMSENEALSEAADVILSPYDPDRKVTLEDIARGTPA